MTSTFKGLLRSTKSSPHAGPHDPSAEALQRQGPLHNPMTPAAIEPGPNYGIKVLYDGSAEAKADIDVVFVHGLTGNAYSTWFHKDAGVHWPSALLGRDIKDARILSFGYDADIINIWKPASNSRLSNHAEHLVRSLERVRRDSHTENRRIIFVSHSLGGLVTKCALNHSRNAEEHLRQVERHTIGVMFLGVPHCGADLASWLSVGTQMIKLLKRANEDIVGVSTFPSISHLSLKVPRGFTHVLAV